MSCEGHRDHRFVTGDCKDCGHPYSEHPDGYWTHPPTQQRVQVTTYPMSVVTVPCSHGYTDNPPCPACGRIVAFR